MASFFIIIQFSLQVNQTGDLASLSYLSEQQLALLSNLVKLRDALYSTEFRNFLRAVTGCGPLSGIKRDMSVNAYRKGCHLLNHDDVIGTRRVSYILYMPLPNYQLWQREWGGALELYPVKEREGSSEGVLEPEPGPVPTKSIPPVWNQFVLFEVQPGRSFHSVEEVVVGEGEDGWQRLSISGWFHAAQPGEDGYEGDVAQSVPSSREQLVSGSRRVASLHDPLNSVLIILGFHVDPVQVLPRFGGPSSNARHSLNVRPHILPFRILEPHVPPTARDQSARVPLPIRVFPRVVRFPVTADRREARCGTARARRARWSGQGPTFAYPTT